MGLRTWSGTWNAALLVAVGSLWLASGTQHEKAVLAGVESGTVRALEVQVAMAPGDALRRRDLAQAYLDVHAPGLAVGVVECQRESRGDHSAKSAVPWPQEI